jgi:hypothetical protein
MFTATSVFKTQPKRRKILKGIALKVEKRPRKPATSRTLLLQRSRYDQWGTRQEALLCQFQGMSQGWQHCKTVHSNLLICTPTLKMREKLLL